MTQKCYFLNFFLQKYQAQANDSVQKVYTDKNAANFRMNI